MRYLTTILYCAALLAACGGGDPDATITPHPEYLLPADVPPIPLPPIKR